MPPNADSMQWRLRTPFPLAQVAEPDAAPARCACALTARSFTFVNDLPHQLVNIAKSLGKEVEVANSTIGGCTVYYQRAETDAREFTRYDHGLPVAAVHDCL